MVDYSKFDGIGDDEEEEVRPRVTRLDEASKVVVGRDGWAVAPRGIDYSKWDRFDDAGSEDEAEPNQYYEDEVFAQREAEARAAAQPVPGPRPRADQSVATDGAGTLDGSRFFVWTQTSDDVTAWFATSARRARDVTLDVSFDKQQRRCRLRLDAFRATLKHDVWCARDDRPHFRLADSDAHAEELSELDWGLEDAPPTLATAKCVRVTINKRPPDRGVVVWWSRLFEPRDRLHEDVIDTTRLKARTKRSTPKDAASFQQVWDDSHLAFMDKVANRQGPVTIDDVGREEE